MYTTWGAKDFEIEDGKLVSKVNSPEAIAMTEYWVNLVKNGSAPQWATYGWEMAGADLGAGKAAMMWDADRGGYTQNVAGASAQSGNLAFGTVPYPTDADKTEADMKSNLWVWSMAMNSASQNKEAAWYFLQYFTSKDFMQWSGTEGACTDTPRESVLSSDEYVKCLSDAEGYYEAFNTVKDTASITPPAKPRETASSFSLLLRAAKTTSAPSRVDSPAARDSNSARTAADSSIAAYPDSLCGTATIPHRPGFSRAKFLRRPVQPFPAEHLAASMASTIIRHSRASSGRAMSST